MNRQQRRAAGKQQSAVPPSGGAQAAFDLAVALHKAGKLSEAEKGCRQTLAIDARHPGALHLLGLLCLQAGDARQAADWISKAIASDPRPPVFHNNLGSAFRTLGRFEEAEVCFRHALALKPDYLRAQINLGHALDGRGNSEAASTAFRQALKLDSSNLESLRALGVLSHKRGAFADAAECYERALSFAPANNEILENLVSARLAQGRVETGLSHLRDLLSRVPTRADLWALLGGVLEGERRWTDAAEAYRSALRAKPDFAPAHKGLGNVSAYLGQVEEAVLAYRQAVKFAPDDLEIHSDLIMTMVASSDASAGNILAEARAFAAHAEMAPACSIAKSDASSRALRVGYVSADFRDHPVGAFLERVLPAHDPSQFEVILYSDVKFEDAQTEKLRASAKGWRFIAGRNDADVAQMIGADGIDILVDLAGHTAGNRLGVFGRRAAPVQASWLGFCCTTGLSAMDYIIADPVVLPEGDEAFYSERPIRLDGSYLCWSPPALDIPTAPFPAQAQGFVTFGSFNNRTKISLETVALWARILRRVPNAMLYLKAISLADEGCRAALSKEFATHGIGAERLLLQGHAERAAGLATYNRVDIALDTLCYSGCTTTAEALWMGVPVVTMAGARWSGRMSSSVLSRVGLDDWICPDTDSYVERAVQWAENLAGIAPSRAALRERVEKSALCDGARFTRGLEAAYRRMWRGEV